MELTEAIKVSVVILTYNHERFIEKAIDSVMAQQTDFVFEIIIADDSSTDNTAQIIKNTLARYLEKQHVYYHRNASNMGVMRNWRQTHDKLQGQYFAFCEGDDYWTNPLKLQKQVDFLDANPDFALCFHNVLVSFLDTPQAGYLLNENISKDVFTTSDMVGTSEIWFMATASLMFRTNTLSNVPAWLVKSKSGDIPLIILASLKGKIKYLPELMAVYQKHCAGVSMTDHKDDEVFLRNRIYMYRMLDSETHFRYRSLFRQNIGGYYYLLLYAKQLKHRVFERALLSIYYVILTFPNTPHMRVVLKDHLIPHWLLKLSRLIKRKIGLIPLEA